MMNLNKKNLQNVWLTLPIQLKCESKADKSRNLYRIDPLLFSEILHKITEKYKLDQNNMVDQINKDTSNFTNK